jgi:hypothetical protein
LVLELLGGCVADSLLEGTGAITALVHEPVIDHLTCRTNQVLHLVSDHSSIEQVHKTFFDMIKSQGLSAAAVPDEWHRIASSVEIVWLIQVIFAADIDILALKATLTNDVRQNKD